MIIMMSENLILLTDGNKNELHFQIDTNNL